jgi:hypothetical protein
MVNVTRYRSSMDPMGYGFVDRYLKIGVYRPVMASKNRAISDKPMFEAFVSQVLRPSKS